MTKLYVSYSFRISTIFIKWFTETLDWIMRPWILYTASKVTESNGKGDKSHLLTINNYSSIRDYWTVNKTRRLLACVTVYQTFHSNEDWGPVSRICIYIRSSLSYIQMSNVWELLIPTRPRKKIQALKHSIEVLKFIWFSRTNLKTVRPIRCAATSTIFPNHPHQS